MSAPKQPGMSLDEAEGIARGVARMGVAEHDESPQARQSRVVLALMAEVDRVRKGGAPEVLDARHFSRQARWSRDTFGDGARTAAILDHIRKELLEIEADPTDLSEWVDVLILAADGAWRAGHTPQALVAAVIAKQAKNEARVWPDWRTAEPGKAIEHDRSADTGQARKLDSAREDDLCACHIGTPAWIAREAEISERVNRYADAFAQENRRLLAIVHSLRARLGNLAEQWGDTVQAPTAEPTVDGAA